MERKRLLVLPSEFKAVDDADEGQMVRDSIITTQRTDRDNEVVETGGLRNAADYAEGKLPLVLLWQHDQRTPIGHAQSVEVRKTQIKTRDLYAPTAFVRDTVWPLIEAGSIRSKSIGFIGHNGEDRKGNWHWTDWSLLEHSLVSVPSNPDAIVQMAKACGYEYGPLLTKGPVAVDYPAHEDTDAPWDATAAEKRVRVWAGAEEGPSAKYRSCFAWYDADDADNFRAYKLLMCDVFEGKPEVVWRACAAIMGVLAGGRGGVDIPAADKEKVRALVARYYEKFGKEPPEKAADDSLIWKAGEQQIIEVCLFTERKHRLVGAAQGMADIVKHWQGAGLDPLTLRALDEEDLSRLAEAQAHLDTVLRAGTVSETAEGDPVIEAVVEDPYAGLKVWAGA